VPESAKRIKRNTRDPLRLDDVPDDYLRNKVLEYIKTRHNQSCRLEILAENVFIFAKFGCRGDKKETLLARIWAIVDALIEAGEIVQAKANIRLK
jgi:hypothetical protein